MVPVSCLQAFVANAEWGRDEQIALEPFPNHRFVSNIDINVVVVNKLLEVVCFAITFNLDSVQNEGPNSLFHTYFIVQSFYLN